MILLNASNLHGGGGVQVATSVIQELSFLSDLPTDLHIWASKEVDSNLRKLKVDLGSFQNYDVVDSFGFKLFLSPFFFKMNKFKAIFTIFGPLYLIKVKGINICGFAQPWIIYPKNELYSSIGYYQRLFTRFKYWLQVHLYKRADFLVVELEHVRSRLILLNVSAPDRISVVNNCLSSVYSSPLDWLPIDIPSRNGAMALGFIGRNYPHKNTKIFPQVASLLLRIYGVRVVFYVTFTKAEWEACDLNFQKSAVNIGEISVAQCPSFYSQMDAIVFPSLLECFSATPLEAMAMKKLLFVSDRRFNRDICGEYAYYFDPLSPESLAKSIATVFGAARPTMDLLEKAQTHAFHFSNPKFRAKAYLKMLCDARVR